MLPSFVCLASYVISKLKSHSQPHRARLQRSCGREKIAQAGGRKIYELRAKIEDRFIEWIEDFDLRRELAAFAEIENARSTQVD